MSLSVTCPQCHRSLAFPSGAAGRPGQCPHCGKQFTVPATTAPPAPAAKKPLLIDNRYEVIGELGRGNMGVVYHARDTKLGREVAVKMLLDRVLASDDSVKRFRTEAAVASRITHPYVLPVLDFGTSEQGNYIVFLYVKGTTLKEVIPKEGFPDSRRAVRLALKLVQALDHVFTAHRILHRDVKPGNMMLVNGDESAPFLMDFGLAVALDSFEDQSRQTQDGTVMGTPAYMAPEQVRGEIAAIGHHSDLYSAGAVLFQLLTGRVPFTGKWAPPDFPLAKQIASDPPPSLMSLRPDLDPALNRIVQRSLAKQPRDRFRAGKEFADALQGWLDSTTGTFQPLASGGAALPPPARRSGSLGVVAVPVVQATPQASGPGSSVVERTTVPVVAVSKVATSREQPPELAPPALPKPKASRWGLWLALGTGSLVVVGIVVAVLVLQKPKAAPETPSSSTPKGERLLWNKDPPK